MKKNKEEVSELSMVQNLFRTSLETLVKPMAIIILRGVYVIIVNFICVSMI